ncbi:hypothetical protein B7P43_G15693 [Cryptotermes secundus]|uniref:Reverse transcriptase domain-containing protein n=2 Tax=Cryptotermes secundus TaxID=105785 RepID=A0A2J7QRB1_9NEOP|nr:hypothetical protein B7P43_G15693 [Cryptotermes secundus]
MQTYNLFYIVDFPTRIVKESCTAIDNIFLHCSRVNTYHVHSVKNDLSDHDAQYLVINNVCGTQRNKNTPVKKRLITKTGVMMFMEALQNETWDMTLSSVEVDTSFNAFLNTFIVIFESCFPMQFVMDMGHKNQWITGGIKVLCRCKRYLYIISRVTHHIKIREYYSCYCSILRRVIRKAKEMYYNEMLMKSTNKSEMSWKIINNEIGCVAKRKAAPADFKNGEIKIEINKAAGFFNTYFIDSVEKLISQYPKTEDEWSATISSLTDKLPEIVNILITKSEISGVISLLKNKGSCGYDGISNKFIRLCSKQITKPLMHIFNLSLTTGIYPDRLKYANIIPCFKKGSITEISNYRPISLLTGFSKIFEILIYNRVIIQFNFISSMNHYT